MTEYEWNPPERLPPVGCPLVILYTPGGEGANMRVTGRYRWSYP